MSAPRRTLTALFLPGDGRMAGKSSCASEIPVSSDTRTAGSACRGDVFGGVAVLQRACSRSSTSRFSRHDSRPGKLELGPALRGRGGYKRSATRRSFRLFLDPASGPPKGLTGRLRPGTAEPGVRRTLILVPGGPRLPGCGDGVLVAGRQGKVGRLRDGWYCSGRRGHRTEPSGS